MICRISGKLIAKKANSVVVDVAGISYEVFLPGIVMNQLDGAVGPEGEISLITYHYLQSTPSQSVPVMIGFLNEVEREFFEKFITVYGVGPKAACKALALPFPSIVRAIDEGDIATLKGLKGIGEQRAREIVAKLQGKVAKFGLIRDSAAGAAPVVHEDAMDEALQVLLQLQYNRSEAQEMLKKAISRNPGMKSSEEILNEVYKQRSKEQCVET